MSSECFLLFFRHLLTKSHAMHCVSRGIGNNSPTFVRKVFLKFPQLVYDVRYCLHILNQISGVCTSSTRNPHLKQNFTCLNPIKFSFILFYVMPKHFTLRGWTTSLHGIVTVAASSHLNFNFGTSRNNRTRNFLFEVNNNFWTKTQI